ncbi:MAG: rod shape-determining protein MreC [Calditrichaeota bacterium]|nr:rod shape-determining protein MreC [Calditrichota bacterium]
MDSYKKHKFLLLDYSVLTGSIVLSLVLLFTANNSGKTSGLQKVGIEVLGFAASPVQDFKSLVRVRAKNRRLAKENAELQLDLSRYKEAFRENVRLRKLVGFGIRRGLSVVPARVIGRNNMPGVKTILLDVGSNKEIKSELPVVSGEGLVGKVIHVTPNYSTVQLVIDRNFRAAARIQRNRETGIFEMTGKGFGVLSGVHHRVEIIPGDTVITTGMESLYPAGFVIGIVDKVDDSQPGLFQNIRVAPRVNFTRLEEAFVVLNDYRMNGDDSRARKR